ncbi:MAG: hypothetical protein P4L40_04230 [Terracidiphilus sp.]|nr:hypothetical protein [Terracidiphilus sp.]
MCVESFILVLGPEFLVCLVSLCVCVCVCVAVGLFMWSNRAHFSSVYSDTVPLAPRTLPSPRPSVALASVIPVCVCVCVCVCRPGGVATVCA